MVTQQTVDREEAPSITDDFAFPSFEDSNSTAFEEIEEGLYTLELVDIKEPQPVAPQWNPDGTRMRAQFVFHVVDDPDWEGYRVNDWFNITMHENGRLYPVAKALLGGSFPKNQRVVPSMLLHKRMQAYLELGDENDKGRRYPNITNPIPVKKKRGETTTTIEAKDLANADTGDIPF